MLPISIDMSDGLGNGTLIATDRIFVIGGSANNASVGSVTGKILYRMRLVGIEEYVGIVQSQQ